VALAIGVIVGTYSSIYIASAIALDLKLTARDLLPVQKEKGAIDEMP
jgi:preprotein translocase subunit SecF